MAKVTVTIFQGKVAPATEGWLAETRAGNGSMITILGSGGNLADAKAKVEQGVHNGAAKLRWTKVKGGWQTTIGVEEVEGGDR